jgi:hypothetical protein
MRTVPAISIARLDITSLTAINSDYNNFVARVALEVVDGSWWKQQVRVKSAGSGATALSSSNEGHRRSVILPL